MRNRFEADKLPPHIQAMLAPAFYDHETRHVDLVQTHISYVLLTDDTVYKLKKQVRFSFLDFSTLERRRHFCHEEVRLNRRLAPDVYRGVMAIARDGDTYRLAEEDEPDAVEYVVVMRRLPADRVLASMLGRNAVTAEMIDAVVDRLVAFHGAAERGPEVRAAGDPKRIRMAMDEDFQEMRRFRGTTIAAADDEAIIDFCHRSLERFTPLLAQRIAAGRVCDGHGDLHAEHVCLTDPLIIFDCIEFNPDFRRRDVAAEIAFLAMDLEFRGHPRLAERLVSGYADAAADPELPRLVPFFKAHRAYIRGKVDSLTADEPEVGDDARSAAADSARRHFDLAYRYTWAGVRWLVVVVGLSGSGKSTVAEALQRRTGFRHLSSDIIRKQLAGIPPTSRAGAADESGLYAPEQSARTYARMLELAGEELQAGRGVIVDATFQRRVDRDAVRELAAQRGAPLLFVECQCDAEETIRRLRARQAANADPSDADERVYERQRAAYEPFEEDEVAQRAVVDTTAETSAVVAQIEIELRRST